MNKIDLKHLAGYDEDLALWSAEQAALIRAGKFDRVDLENVAEEIESLGKSVKSEIRSRLKILLIHLLKYRFQPSKRTPSWRATIQVQRIELHDLLEENPSLRNFPAEILGRAYGVARLGAVSETKLAPASFPMTSPFTIENVLDQGHFPPAAPQNGAPARRVQRKLRIRGQD